LCTKVHIMSPTEPTKITALYTTADVGIAESNWPTLLMDCRLLETILALVVTTIVFTVIIVAALERAARRYYDQ
jgi:hypothetical protein